MPFCKIVQDSGGGYSGVDYSQDFTDANQAALDANWTALTGSKYTLDTTNDEVDAPLATSSWIYTANQVNTLNQWVYAKQLSTPGSLFAGVVLRSENNAANPHYFFRQNSGTTMTLSSADGHTTNVAIYTWTRSIANGDYFGFCVTGTGASTDFHLFDFGTTDPALTASSSLADMKTAADAWVQVNSSTPWDNAPGVDAADVGKYGGFYKGTTAASIWDDWNFGDYNP